MLQQDGRKLAFWGLVFMPPGCASRLLGQDHKITEVINVLFLLLDSQAPPYNETPDWMQSYYTWEQTGDYVVL